MGSGQTTSNMAARRVIVNTAADPKAMEIVSGGVEQEANQALINMGAILKSVGCTYKNVVKTTVLLDDIKDFVAVNNIYKKFFSSHEPARAAYQAAALPKGAKVEIEAIAVVGEIQDE